MSHPELTDREPVHVPAHHFVFLVAVAVTVAAIVLQAVYGSTQAHPVVGQALTTLRVAAVIGWCWFFATHICRRLDHIEDRLSALEGDGLDDESELALRRINRRLSRDAR